MFNNFKSLKNEPANVILLITLVSLFPIFIIAGEAINNLFIIIVSLIFLFISFENKKIFFLKNYYAYLLLFFLLTLIINIFFSEYGKENYSRQLGFVRFICLIFVINFCLNFSCGLYRSTIFSTWFLIFLITAIDLFYEFIFGFNILGNTSYMPGRLSGFLGDELKIGNYFFGFFLISLTYLLDLNSFKNYYPKIIIIIFFIVVSFLIGERSNFIRIFASFIFFLYFYQKFSLNLKLVTTKIIILIILSSVFLNNNIKSRMKQIYEPVAEFGISKYIKTSHYGAHYDTALKIFDNYKIFGIGLKQFRNESKKEIYDENENNIYKRDNWATHPHQIHFEILSESGLFGYISFLIFFLLSIIKSIKSYLKNRNNYLLSGIIFILISLIPILPSGSFFTTYTATIFWINYALIVSFDNDEFKNKKL
tara:strand:+ start:21311 stop:22579 length:1269 start_codon:yes stop_codon:yes gene_type:complete